MKSISTLMRAKTSIESTCRRTYGNANMVKRKDLRRLKKINIYNKEISGTFYSMQDNPITILGSYLKDWRQWVTHWRQEKTFILGQAQYLLNFKRNFLQICLSSQSINTTFLGIDSNNLSNLRSLFNTLKLMSS